MIVNTLIDLDDKSFVLGSANVLKIIKIQNI